MMSASVLGVDSIFADGLKSGESSTIGQVTNSTRGFYRIVNESRGSAGLFLLGDTVHEIEKDNNLFCTLAITNGNLVLTCTDTTQGRGNRYNIRRY